MDWASSFQAWRAWWRQRPRRQPKPARRQVRLTDFHDPSRATYDEAMAVAIGFLAARGGGDILIPPGSFLLARPMPDLPEGVALKAWKPAAPDIGAPVAISDRPQISGEPRIDADMTQSSRLDSTEGGQA